MFKLGAIWKEIDKVLRGGGEVIEWKKERECVGDREEKGGKARGSNRLKMRRLFIVFYLNIRDRLEDTVKFFYFFDFKIKLIL